MGTSTEVWTFFCFSLIGYLYQVSKSNPLAREKISILTLSKNDTLRSKGCRPLAYFTFDSTVGLQSSLFQVK